MSVAKVGFTASQAVYTCHGHQLSCCLRKQAIDWQPREKSMINSLGLTYSFRKGLYSLDSSRAKLQYDWHGGVKLTVCSQRFHPRLGPKNNQYGERGRGEGKGTRSSFVSCLDGRILNDERRLVSRL